MIPSSMKDCASYLPDKTFLCNGEGCSVKFTAEDHLMVHKKRRDMILNLGLNSKNSATFVDQTPTPTQFIRNCEEVGLFQDLQNINPFEETFKKAVEAVKDGQPLIVEKSSQLNSIDDTLHTPNIFPHITDVPTVGQHDSDLKSENIPPCEEVFVKPDLSENVNSVKTSIKNYSLNQTVSSQQKNEPYTPMQSLVTPGSKTGTENKVILNVPEGHFVRFITPENTQTTCNMVVIKNSDTLYSSLPLTIKEKLKKSLNERKNTKMFQPKVPISKCPTKKPVNSISNKFSKFSKNALKLISKIENSESEVHNSGTVSSKRQKKRNMKSQSKESRSEFLARSRAASSRCREKKKMYVLYLEKVNSDLSAANQNLQLINISLQKQIYDLHSELLKHKNCNMADKNTEAALLTMVNKVDEKLIPEKKKPTELKKLSSPSDEHLTQSQLKSSSPKLPCEDSSTADLMESIADPNFTTLDVAEVILSETNEENEIPLNDCNKTPDIIVRFNSVGNDFLTKFPPDTCLRSYIENAKEDVKRIYAEHSYFLKKAVTNVQKQLVNYKTFKETISTSSAISSHSNVTLNVASKNSSAFSDITAMNTKSIVEPRTPPPLILLKPFKKRTLQSKHAEKT